MPEFRDLYCDFQDSIKFYIFLLDGSQSLGLSNFSIFIASNLAKKTPFTYFLHFLNNFKIIEIFVKGVSGKSGFF